MGATPDGHDHDHSSEYDAYQEWDAGGAPAKVKTVAKRLEGELAKRMRRVKGLVRETIATNDALRLGRDALQADAYAAPVDDFRFTDNANKERAFRRWFSNALEDEFLEPATEQQILDGEHYTATYVRSAYTGGVNHADRGLRDVGVEVSDETVAATLQAPIHREQIRTLYRRQFSELEGLTDETGRVVSRTLSDSLASGEGPYDAARDLNDRIDAYGITNSRRTARTELARSYNHAATKRYEQHGVQKVDVLTYNPCSQCKEIEAGAPYKVKESRGLLPAHPNCRCSLSPIVN